jgi:hypothetical protein
MKTGCGTLLQGGVFMHVKNSKTAVALILTLLSLCICEIRGCRNVPIVPCSICPYKKMLFEILIWQPKKSFNDDTYLP